MKLLEQGQKPQLALGQTIGLFYKRCRGSILRLPSNAETKVKCQMALLV